jgi:hypothetical protein
MLGYFPLLWPGVNDAGEELLGQIEQAYAARIPTMK